MTLQTAIRDLDNVETIEGIAQLKALYEIQSNDIEADMAAEFDFEMDDGV